MNIVYIGTPEYSCIPLKALINAGHLISLVITQPDKPKGRGNKFTPSPVKVYAENLGIKVISPNRIKENEEVLNEVKQANPDFVISFSYGKIVPESILNVPKYESLNLHASILPKYRGAAPIQRAVLNGEAQTGMCIMRMEKGLDTGGVFAMEKTSIDRKTSAELFLELANVGAKMLVESLEGIAKGEIKAIPQDDSLNTYAEMISKEEGHIDWHKTAKEIDCLVRAFNDSPVAWTILGDKVLKVFSVEFGQGSGEPGTVLSTSKEGIEVACLDKSLYITTLQAPGKNKMDASAFLLGNKIDTGSVLE